MFDKIAAFLDKNLSTPMAKLSEQRHLRAIRDGIIATLPIVVVSSLFLVIAFLPNQMPASWGIAQFIKANAGRILLPYRMAMYIMTLYAVFGIGFSLAKSYDLDGLSGAILSELAFSLTPSRMNKLLYLLLYLRQVKKFKILLQIIRLWRII